MSPSDNDWTRCNPARKINRNIRNCDEMHSDKMQIRRKWRTVYNNR